jgi:hypothetical protein
MKNEQKSSVCVGYANTCTDVHVSLRTTHCVFGPSFQSVLQCIHTSNKHVTIAHYIYVVECPITFLSDQNVLHTFRLNFTKVSIQRMTSGGLALFTAQYQTHNSINNTKMTAFWDISRYSLVEVYRRFRGAYCLHK